MTCVVLTPGAFARRAFAAEAFAVGSDIWARNSPADDIWIRDGLPSTGAQRRITTTGALRVTTQGPTRITTARPWSGWQLSNQTADRIVEDGPTRITEAGEVRIVPAPRAQWIVDHV